MKYMNKLERKFGKYAIENLSMWIIATYVIGFIVEMFMPELMRMLVLEPYYIFNEGQVWRLITWIFTPPSSFSIFTIIMLFFYYSLGNSLERTWGAFRYNLYIFAGIIFTTIGSLILYFVLRQPISLGGYFSTYFINMSIFLAFAACYPNMQIMLYFVVPIKIKWIAYLNIVLLAWQFMGSGVVGRVAIVVSLLNFLIFFFGTRNYKQMSVKEIQRKKVYRQQTQVQPNVTRHQCATCGRTEKDGADLEFRFCSKCDGNYEYCQDHLFTHEHKKHN